MELVWIFVKEKSGIFFESKELISGIEQIGSYLYLYLYLWYFDFGRFVAEQFRDV